MVEVIPSYTKTNNRVCSDALEPIKTFPFNTIESCESACNQKNDCLGFSFDPDETKPCHLFDVVPKPSGQTKNGAACYVGMTECPSMSAPHCSIEAEVTCTLRDDPTKECSEYAASFPEEVPANAIGCQVYLKYDYKLTARTTEQSTWTWATRTRKGDEPMDFDRAREYSWLDEGNISPSGIPGPATAPFASSETVLVDFCKPGKYKTMAEAVIQTDSNTICSNKHQYKLIVKGATSPITPGTTPTPVPPAVDLGDCGFEDPIVGCVIAEGQTGLPQTWTDTTDCNDYVPVTENDCKKQVRYTYYVYHGNEPSGSKLIDSYRYREGDARPYAEGKWGTTIASGDTGTFYELDTCKYLSSC